MVSPYTNAIFNPLDNPEYPAEGNYGASYLRQEVVLKAYDAISKYYSVLDSYTIMPKQLPGNWQSAAVQTSLNASLNSMGAGASSYMHWVNDFAINNGLDGKNYIPTGFWSSQQVDASGDKLWVPSAFELQHTGYGSSESELISHSQIPYDNNYEIGQVNNGGIVDAVLSNPQGDTRTGLWEMSAYDRATNVVTWIRTGMHTIPYGAEVPNMARAMNTSGHHGYVGVQAEIGLQVGIHINLKQLIEDNFVSVDEILNSSGAINSQPIVDGGFSEADLENVQNDYKNYLLGKYVKSSLQDSGTVLVEYNVTSNDYIVDNITINNQKITLVNGKSSVSTNGICDINSYTMNNKVYVQISNIATNITSVQPYLNYYYNVNLNLANNNNQNSIMIINSQNQTMTIKLNQLGEFEYNIVNLICDREYMITLVGEVKFDTEEVNILVNGQNSSSYLFEVISDKCIKFSCTERDSILSINNLKII